MFCLECNNEVKIYKAACLCTSCYKKRYYIKNKEKLDKKSTSRYYEKKQDIESIKCLQCLKLVSISNRNMKYCSKYCADKYTRSLRKDEVNKYFKNLYQTNINRKISSCLRSRLTKALNGSYKKISYNEYIGCTPSDLKQHLESKFLTGMSWDNYGLSGWHIDHVKPLSSFDLSDKQELLKACHYSNLQPLWAKDNIAKGNKHEK